jgi:hypothetical protein
LPPQSSPESRPRREASGPEAAHLRRMYPPRGGSPRRIKPFHGPLSAGACPQAPVDGCWRSQRPTDAARVAYRRKTVGLQSSPQVRVRPTRRPNACLT